MNYIIIKCTNNQNNYIKKSNVKSFNIGIYSAAIVYLFIILLGSVYINSNLWLILLYAFIIVSNIGLWFILYYKEDSFISDILKINIFLQNIQTNINKIKEIGIDFTDPLFLQFLEYLDKLINILEYNFEEYNNDIIDILLKYISKLQNINQKQLNYILQWMTFVDIYQISNIINGLNQFMESNNINIEKIKCIINFLIKHNIKDSDSLMLLLYNMKTISTYGINTISQLISNTINSLNSILITNNSYNKNNISLYENIKNIQSNKLNNTYNILIKMQQFILNQNIIINKNNLITNFVIDAKTYIEKVNVANKILSLLKNILINNSSLINIDLTNMSNLSSLLTQIQPIFTLISQNNFITLINLASNISFVNNYNYTSFINEISQCLNIIDTFSTNFQANPHKIATFIAMTTQS